MAMEVVSQRLGHATIMMTVDTYGHVLPIMDAEAAAEIEAAIQGSPTDRPRTPSSRRLL